MAKLEESKVEKMKRLWKSESCLLCSRIKGCQEDQTMKMNVPRRAQVVSRFGPREVKQSLGSPPAKRCERYLILLAGPYLEHSGTVGGEGGERGGAQTRACSGRQRGESSAC
jgi:hypothetical protein